MAAAPAPAASAALAQLDAVDVSHPFDAALTDVAASLSAMDLVVRAFCAWPPNADLWQGRCLSHCEPAYFCLQCVDGA
jgi:hypothetical protein